MNDVHIGHCLCGTVRFRTAGPLREVIACHCSQCRRQSGHFYAATNVKDANLAVEGADNVAWYRATATAGRGFCRTCGSVLFWKGDETDYTSIMAGAFDQPTGLKIACHIYCADKGDYYEIEDGAPQYAQNYR
ncbi:MAG TPA: GFA family protein [Mycoplana sp.]|nr:GFA family protein [Mycoplana sp.]